MAGPSSSPQAQAAAAGAARGIAAGGLGNPAGGRASAIDTETTINVIGRFQSPNETPLATFQTTSGSYLENPYGLYQPISPVIYDHIADRHFTPRARASLFRPEWRNPAGQTELYLYLITHAVPAPSLLRPNAFTLSATFDSPVGWERGTGMLTYNVSAVVLQIGVSNDGTPYFTPLTQYPGLP